MDNLLLHKNIQSIMIINCKVISLMVKKEKRKKKATP